MKKSVLERIQSVEKKIVTSMDNEDFISISNLSEELDTLIKEFTNNVKSAKNLSKDVKELETLLSKLDFFKKQTSEIFKNYRSKVSAQTTMHKAYKKYSG